ncbi:hypothetical protein [Wenzhouxiangella sp. XN24]|uniref:hypothetical protein n=1 Tax=Wenzhouxiangella sp. XN24 TaxID=2713569 RepID=UPI0013EC256E|nr:hypothetical protein [Wenzhouxiangella sp. XN24]NGX16377.1 hypothetical protein [Wenzhouxiangella sp. XN24]
MRRIFLLLCLSIVSAPADACRCAQRSLADYFDGATEVTTARLIAARQNDADPARLELRFEIVAPAWKSSRTLAVGTQINYSTASSSAACGLSPESGAIYVLFAYSSAETPEAELHVDTCSGSRVLLPADGRAPEGFKDVPARFVSQQLNALAGLAVLGEVAAAQPDPTDPDNTTLVGLLDVSGFSHAGHARLLESPARDAPIILQPEGYADLQSREVDYEVPAAVVYAHVDGWYKLRTADGVFGWLPPDYAGTFFPYADLLVRRLAYVSLPWHGFVWPAPGAGLPLRMLPPEGKHEQPVEVLETQIVGGSPWFRVNLMTTSPCEGGESARGTGGWVPAYREDGTPLAWFYSRGC